MPRTMYQDQFAQASSDLLEINRLNKKTLEELNSHSVQINNTAIADVPAWAIEHRRLTDLYEALKLKSFQMANLVDELKTKSANEQRLNERRQNGVW